MPITTICLTQVRLGYLLALKSGLLLKIGLPFKLVLPVLSLLEQVVDNPTSCEVMPDCTPYAILKLMS